MEFDQLHDIRRLSLADQVYDALTIQFMSGSWSPGQRLKIDAIAADLGVSQTPVREALVRLEFTGFIERDSPRGHVVALLPNAQDIVKLMDARLLLEPSMAFAAAKFKTAGFVTELEKTIETMMLAHEEEDTARSLRNCWLADEQFHNLISKQGDNHFLAAAYRALGGQLQRFRIIGKAGVPQAQAATSEHVAIFEAITSESEEEAKVSMMVHLVNAKTRAIDDLSRVS